MSALDIRPAGDRSLLVVPADADVLAGMVARLRRRPIAGVCDVLPAARTVLVTLAAGARTEVVEARLRELAEPAALARSAAADGEDPLVIPVRYDGADLSETAALLDISEEELIARHTGAAWRCAFVGFAPGFGYLHAPDAGLSVARREQSRTAVPVGAVALAGGYSAVYPRRTPGGWRLIGSTSMRMWDLDRAQPALLRPGTAVRFVRVGDR